MSRKDFILIAEILISQINRGNVKKKDIDEFIAIATNKLSTTNTFFSYDKFESYVKDGTKCL